MTNISVWGIFLVKKMVSSHLFHVIFVHKGQQQSPLKKKKKIRDDDGHVIPMEV